MRGLRRAAAWGTFPVLLGGSLLGAWLARRAGVPASVVLGGTTLGALGILLGLERLLPFSRAWHPDARSVRTDLLHALLSNALASEAVKAAGLSLVLALLARRATAAGLWPTAWPLPLQVGLAMVLGELCFYTLHRAAHEVSWLWPWHAVHHSSAGLTTLSATRNHPVNAVASFVVQTGPAAALGAGEEVLLLLGVFTTVHGLLQHCNVDLQTGRLAYVFATVQQHRWHHSANIEQGSSNYGSNLMVWDLLLGTFQRGHTHGPVAVGLGGGVRLGEGYLEQLRAPLRWGKSQREAAPAAQEAPPGLELSVLRGEAATLPERRRHPRSPSARSLDVAG